MQVSPMPRLNGIPQGDSLRPLCKCCLFQQAQQIGLAACVKTLAITHILTVPNCKQICVAQMQAAYDEYNDHAKSSGKSRGHFIVDLCRPGHLTICLRNFQERIKCNDDNWDAQFGELETLLVLTDLSPCADVVQDNTTQTGLHC